MPIVIPPLYEKTQPGKDFYWHVNRNWHKLADIPSWSSSFGVSEEIEVEVDKELYRIIDSDNDKTIETLVKSALDVSAQKNSVATLKRIIQSFQCLRDADDIARTLAEFALYRMNCLLTAFIVEQEEEQHKNRLYITAGKLGLPDKSYYSGEAPGKTRTMIAYTKLLEDCCIELELPKGIGTAFVQLEASLADAIDRADYDADVPTTLEKLKTDYPAIPFEPFFEALGLPRLERLVIGSRRWFRVIDRLFKTWTLENWRSFFTGSIILHALPVLPPPFDDMHFAFFGRRMRDQVEKIPQRRLALMMVKEWLPVTLSREFIRATFNERKKRAALDFVETLVASAKERLGETSWLDPATRRRAQRKLDAMDLGVAYPDKWPEVAAVELDPENFLENILKLGRAMTLEDFESEGKRSQRSKSWDDPAFAVNAFYYSGGNGLIMPAGILQWPFMSRSVAWNYGALGAAVGHEMTHAFDMDGKNYDERGFLEPWWSVGDNRRYMKKAKELVALFNEADYMGRKVNGALTLSENIADLGGLGIALGALEKTLVGAGSAKRKAALREFFQAYAVSWRTRERKQKAYQSLIIDRHAPPTLRVNLIVAQFDAWYEAFDIQEDAPLWIAPEKRIRIF